jgi:hypothetical protein
MKKKILSFFLIIATFFPPSIFARTITCESVDNSHSYCRIKNNGNIRIINQLSSAECIKGRTWDYDTQGIWVKEGCRAEFEIGFDDYEFSAGDSGYMTCESQNYGYRYCPAFSIDEGVMLARQISREECVKDRTWGHDRHGVWVKDGCRAEFDHRHSSKRWHKDRHRHWDHHSSDELAATLGIIGGLALLGIILGSEGNNQPPPPYYPESYENRLYSMPDRLIGTFRGYSDFYKETMEINIAPSGIIDGYLAENKIYGIYYNRDEIILNSNIYLVEYTSEGFIARQKDNYNNQIYLKKIR